tara:strand:- start:695 stop:1522 length:828 start_codon:yes stop_codon:yes gene_type:complete
MLLENSILIRNTISLAIGCCFGSFINVIIYRLPLGKSIIFPSSQCTKCQHRIDWFENVPLISWLFLRGRCSNCKENISIIYPIVELVTGLIFLLTNYSEPSSFGVSPLLVKTILGWIFISILIALAILDIKYFWLPDSICKFGIFVGIFSNIILEIIYESSTKYIFGFESIISALLGYLIFKIISAIGLRIFQKPAMGQGDANLSALLGAWLGIKGLFIAIWLAFILAGIFVIIGLISRKLKRGQKIPFGVFLSLSGIVLWNFGNDVFFKLIYLF